MEKMDSIGFDIKKENIEKIKLLFPECVVEDSIDFNILKILLGDSVNFENEKYSFSWNGKGKSLSESISPSASTLIPCKNKSLNWDSTGNLYVEGDNLEVLKTLLKTYHNKVDLIYIDPPYNTGNDFIYFDNFKQDEKDYNERTCQQMKSNPESSGRYHTNWLNMMYPRLKLANEFLNENGVIFISIDDNEVVNLRKICDEIFGSSNFEGQITYVRKTSGKQDSSNFVKSTEYILVYSKNSSWDCKKLIAGENVTERYNKVDKDGKKYRETDLRKTGNADRREDRPLMYYPFYFNEGTNDLQVRKERDQDLLSRGYIEIYPTKPDGSDGRWRWGYSSSLEAINFLVAKEMPKYKGKYTIYEIDYIDKNGEIRTVREHTFWDRKEFNSDNAMLEFKSLGFSNQLFPFPKSSSMLKHIIYLANFEEGIVMDFFSGSGTTAQSVMQLNSEDGGNRKFILVQLPEICEEGSEARKYGFNTICELGEERIRRAGKKIYNELKQKKDSAGLLADTVVDPDSLDFGFKVFKLDSTNIKQWDPTVKHDENSIFDLLDVIKEGRTNLDVAYEVMLKYGVFNMPLEEIQVNGKTVYSVGCGYMIISLNKEITPEDVEAIARLQPKAVVFKESGFVDDNAKINADYTFKRMGIDNVKCI